MIESVIELISEYVNIPADKINGETNLIEELGFNSFDIMSLIGDLSDQYDIEIPMEDILKFRTVIELNDYLESKMAA